MARKSNLVHYYLLSAWNVYSRVTSLSASVQATTKLSVVGVVLLRVVGRPTLHNMLPWKNQFDLHKLERQLVFIVIQFNCICVSVIMVL